MRLKDLPPKATVAIGHTDHTYRSADFLQARGFGECEVIPAAQGLSWEWEFARVVDEDEAGNAHRCPDAYLVDPYHPAAT